MLVLLHLFALFILVLLGFYVFVADPRSRANQTFAVFIAFLALWTTKDLVFWNFYPDTIGPAAWAALSFIVALIMQYALVVFAWVFPENARTPRRKGLVLFAPGLVLFPAAAAGYLWSTIGYDGENFTIELTAVAYAFVAYVYFLFFYGAWILSGKYRRYSGTQMGQQVGAVLWALLITGLLKTIANIALPYFENYDLLPFSAIFFLPGVLIYAYAISNFKLFSLQTALDQFRLFPITYKVALSISSVAILSFLLFQIPITWWAFRNGMDVEAWRRYLVFSVISALVPNLLLVLLIVRSISRPLQRLTLAAVAVAKGAYGSTADLRKSNDEIGLLAESFNEMSRKMASDIDRLKQMNEQLMQADRLAAMGTLAAGVAHEVNNPLASMSSLLQMIKSDASIDRETLEQLDIVSAQIDRIAGVTLGLTDFARQRPAARKPISVAEVVESALRLASFDASFQRLTLDNRVSSDLPNVMADADQLQQVFLNLLLNARDAMPAGGTIRLESSIVDGTLAIAIGDTGTGLDRATANKAFEPFFTTKAPGKGTGLGLAVCYGIVTAHGGTIEIAEPESGGAEFIVRLPASTKKGSQT